MRVDWWTWKISKHSTGQGVHDNDQLCELPIWQLLTVTVISGLCYSTELTHWTLETMLFSSFLLKKKDNIVPKLRSLAESLSYIILPSRRSGTSMTMTGIQSWGSRTGSRRRNSKPASGLLTPVYKREFQFRTRFNQFRILSVFIPHPSL